MILPLPTIGRALVGALVVLAPSAMLAGSALADETAVPGPPSPEVAALGITCPVGGPNNFTDTYGAPRSGGRSHEGVDMMAERGTPLVAALDGYAEFKRSNAGGNAIWLTTADGNKFYYAHLDAWEGESRDVVAGETIGYAGSTGNTGVSHLHFEVHPGGVTVNPTPYAAEACRPKPIEAPPEVVAPIIVSPAFWWQPRSPTA